MRARLSGLPGVQISHDSVRTALHLVGHPHIDKGDEFHQADALPVRHRPARHPDPVAALDGDKALAQLLLRGVEGITAHVVHRGPQLLPAGPVRAGGGRGGGPDGICSFLCVPQQFAALPHHVLPVFADQNHRLPRPQADLLYILKLRRNLSQQSAQFLWKQFQNLILPVHPASLLLPQYMRQALVYDQDLFDRMSIRWGN